MLSCSKGMVLTSTCLFFFSAHLKNFSIPTLCIFLCFLVCFLRQFCSSLLPPIFGKKPPHLLMLPWNLHQSENCFLRLLHSFCLLFTNSNDFFICLCFRSIVTKFGIMFDLMKKKTLQCRHKWHSYPQNSHLRPQKGRQIQYNVV